MWRRVVCCAALVVGTFGSAVPRADAVVPWTWPVTGPIIRGFDPPEDPFGAGHRGIDIATEVSTVIVAPEDGVVTFAGKVGGRLFLTIDHGGGVTSTCSWLNAVLVRRGDRVTRGQPVALTGWGHTDEPVPHLHFGVRLDGTYVDPLDYLGWPSVSDLIRLAPLDPPPPAAARSAASRMTSLAYPTMAGVARTRRPGLALDLRERQSRDGERDLDAVPRRRVTQRVRAGGYPGAAVRRVLAGRRGHR